MADTVICRKPIRDDIGRLTYYCTLNAGHEGKCQIWIKFGRTFPNGDVERGLLQARVEALEKALEMGRELVKKHTAADSKGYRDWDVDEWLEAARKLLEGK